MGSRRPILLSVPRYEQPDDVTCGPTCLKQVYDYYGFHKQLPHVIRDTPRNPDGGTLAVNLGTSSIGDGFRPTIYSFNLRVFDPTWRSLNVDGLISKLRQRARAVKSMRLKRTIEAYERYLRVGGSVRFDELSRDLLVEILREGRPILTGLSATYLYRTPREIGDAPDDVGGEPVGHFVVICGYYPRSDRFVVCDPLSGTPLSRTGRYTVDSQRLISAILLGDVTYDAVLLVLAPKRGRAA